MSQSNGKSAALSQQEETLATLWSLRRAWEERPFLRDLYARWFGLIGEELADLPGPTVEIGSGCGNYKDYAPGTISTDVIETPWADRIADAEDLPFDSASIANLVMVDVLHHVPRPREALREAERVLVEGGRLVMLEPYCSALSKYAYRYFHDEGADWTVDPERPEGQSSTEPFDANNAVPTLLFWRYRSLLADWVPGMELAVRRRLAWLAYPLSGGFTGRSLVSRPLWRPALKLDRALEKPMAPVAAFRCLVVLERRGRS